MSRDLTYDGLRGWLLIVIACNHLYGNFVSQVTREPFGFVSAAEGFVFLSGFVAYFVYSRLADNQANMKRKIWKRTFSIYSFHILAIAITFSLVFLFPYHITLWTHFFNAGNWFESPVQSFISAIFLLEHPGYHDILILYLVPMLFLPYAIKAIKTGNVHWVILASCFVWLASLFISVELLKPAFNVLLPDISLNVSYFDPFTWQIYFYMGVFLSYLKFDKNYSYNMKPLFHWMILASAVLLLVLKHWSPEWFSSYFSNPIIMLLLRHVNLLLIVYIFMLWMKNSSWIFTLKYPVFLGQHALPVFAFHTVVVYFLLPVTQPFTTESWFWDVLACLTFVGLLAIPAKLDQRFRRKRFVFENKNS